MALFPVINPLGNGFVVNGFFTDLDPQQRKAAIQKLTLNFIMIGVGTLVIGHLFLLIFGLASSLSDEPESPNSSIAVLQISIPFTRAEVYSEVGTGGKSNY